MLLSWPTRRIKMEGPAVIPRSHLFTFALGGEPSAQPGVAHDEPRCSPQLSTTKKLNEDCNSHTDFGRPDLRDSLLGGQPMPTDRSVLHSAAGLQYFRRSTERIEHHADHGTGRAP